MNIKRKLKQIGTIVLSVLLAIVPMTHAETIQVQADTVQIVQNGYARFGGRSCGKFTVNGEVAFCMEHIKSTPGTGTLGDSKPYYNDLIKTILYYGWGGKGNIFTNEEEGIVRTSFALNYIYTGDPAETGDSSRISGLVLAQPLLDYAQAHLITDMNISFDKDSVEGKILSNGYQQTEEVHIKGDQRNTLTFNVPDGITMHSPTSGFVGNGQVTVRGGDSIFFTADSDAKDFSTGELIGSMGHCQPLLIKTSDPDEQDLVKLGWIDPPNRTSLTVKWQDKPAIQTKAVDVGTDANQGHITKVVIIRDAVSYQNLIPGKEYMVKGTLMDKSTEKALQVDGNDVTSEKTFIPSESSGTVDLEFTLPGSAVVGKTIVAFEKLFQEEVEVAAHADLEDKDQTVNYPEIKITTTACDLETKINEAFPNETTILQDKISYTNLIPGKEYTMKGTLMDKTTGKALVVDGKSVTSEKTFVAEEANGKIGMDFALNSSALAGKDIVVYEKLFFNGDEIASHEDLQDAGQTIAFRNIEIHTIAKNPETQTNEVFPDETIVIEDEVSYTNLIPGKEYIIKGTLMDKETGTPFQEEGEDITSEVAFTAENPDGSITMKFSLKGSVLAGKAVVVFEKLLYEGREIAVHEDLEDEGQTVKIKEVKLKTTATDKVTGGHQATVNETVTIVDKVEYTGLIVNKEYIVKGTLMDKETGKPLVTNGKEVVVEKKFTAEQSDGSVDLEFTFNASALAGKSVVVFEKLFYEGREIAVHENLEDEGQTVKITPKPTEQAKPVKPVKTGDITPVSVMVGVLAGSAFLICCLVVVCVRKRKNNG